MNAPKGPCLQVASWIFEERRQVAGLRTAVRQIIPRTGDFHNCAAMWQDTTMVSCCQTKQTLTKDSSNTQTDTSFVCLVAGDRQRGMRAGSRPNTAAVSFNSRHKLRTEPPGSRQLRTDEAFDLGPWDLATIEDDAGH